MSTATPDTETTPQWIPVVLTKMWHKKYDLVVGAMPVGLLVQRYSIARRDHLKKTGYQREPAIARVNRLARELEKRRVDLPTAILLNLREFSRDQNLREENGRWLFSPDQGVLHVVDGQHRLEALKKLYLSDAGRWREFEIPFVCLLGADQTEEMEQFYVVNSTSKSVRTDLALDLLKQRAENSPTLMEALDETGERWKVEGQTVVEELARTPIWVGRVRFPGHEKGQTTISSGGIVASLKRLLDGPFFAQLTHPQQVKILHAFWQGIRSVLPEAFDDPSKYTIQKSTGVMVLHSLLTGVLEIVRSRGWSVIESESYSRILESTLQNLQGDTASGDFARGSDFWLAGPEGAAGSFSSNAGRRVLLGKLRADLPEVEIE